jgi:hypothetical protein
MKIAKRRGMKRAIVAVVRRMAVVMHRISAKRTPAARVEPTAALSQENAVTFRLLADREAR